jgi:hypothetical protein
VRGIELDPFERIEVGASRGHEFDGAIDFFRHRFVPFVGGVFGESSVPGVDFAQVGKTTLGKKLAKKRELRFADTDRLVAAKHGSITRIFEKHGEDRFRELETKYLELGDQSPTESDSASPHGFADIFSPVTWLFASGTGVGMLGFDPPNSTKSGGP